eukprot:4787770-Pyramimonas_sp.AAC.1
MLEEEEEKVVILRRRTARAAAAAAHSAFLLFPLVDAALALAHCALRRNLGLLLPWLGPAT